MKTTVRTVSLLLAALLFAACSEKSPEQNGENLNGGTQASAVEADAAAEAEPEPERLYDEASTIDMNGDTFTVRDGETFVSSLKKLQRTIEKSMERTVEEFTRSE